MPCVYAKGIWFGDFKRSGPLSLIHKNADLSRGALPKEKAKTV